MGPGPNDRGSSRRHILDAIDASLRRLQTDYVDLYQVHAFDPDTPLTETLSALDDVVKSGKARYVGCSNFRAWELATALGHSARLGLSRLDCVQPRYNLLHREIETELLPLCRDQGVGVIVFNPMAGGLLTGKHRPGQEPDPQGRFGAKLGSTGVMYRKRYWQEESLAAVARLNEFFAAHQKALPTVAVGWVLQQPGVTAAIVGATRPEQLDATLAGADVSFDAAEREALDQVWYDLPRRRQEPGPVR